MPGMRRSQSTTSTGCASSRRQRRRAVAGGHHLVALGREHQLEALAQGLVVVHDQDAVASSPLPSPAYRTHPRAGVRGGATRPRARALPRRAAHPGSVTRDTVRRRRGRLKSPELHADELGRPGWDPPATGKALATGGGRCRATTSSASASRS